MLLSRYHLILFIILFSGVSVSRADVITLKNGDILSGEIIADTVRTVTIRHPILGTITIAKENIAPKAQAVQEQLQQPIQQKMAGHADKVLAHKWQRHFAMGIKGEEGNDISMDINAALDLSWHDEKDRKKFTSAYYYESDDRERNKSKGHANYIRDWLRPDSRWFYYNFVSYEYDSYKWWKHRLAFSGGTGYECVKKENFELRGRVGLGFNNTWGTDNQFDPEGLLGIELSWTPNDIHKISSEFMLYPNMKGLNEYRTWFQSKWEIRLDLLRGMTFEMGMEHEFDSTIDDDSKNEKHYDLIYFGRFGLDF